MENGQDRSADSGSRLNGERTLKVLKFGGTSVGSVERLKEVVAILQQSAQTHRLVVVVSAASGVTNTLVAAHDALQDGTFSADNLAKVLWTRYHALAEGLLQPQTLAAYEDKMREILFEKDGRAKHPVLPVPALQDELLALGERLSAPLIALALRDAGVQASPYDATTLIATDDTFGSASVFREETYRRTQVWHGTLPKGEVPVVTGFIGASPEGFTTTLGRGGSDYSAALLAAALQAQVLERWTDVDGIYTEDPRANAEAQWIPFIQLEEAWSWNHAGKLGMHRHSLDPLIEAGIPVHVRSTATPGVQGTWILPSAYKEAFVEKAF